VRARDTSRAFWLGASLALAADDCFSRLALKSKEREEIRWSPWKWFERKPLAGHRGAAKVGSSRRILRVAATFVVGLWIKAYGGQFLPLLGLANHQSLCIWSDFSTGDEPGFGSQQLTATPLN
jgi:hypothetical protein